MNRYNEMFEYISDILSNYDTHGGVSKNKIKYSRIDHTKRVYKWMLRLCNGYENIDLIDIDSLKIATIFHDSGYCKIEEENHALAGVDICRNYLLEHNYPVNKIDFICDLIRCHSDKDRLMDNIPIELILLIEADLLDDTGAHGIVMDIWIEALNDSSTFESMLEHIEKFTYKIMQNNPMRTSMGKKIWNEKMKITNEFYNSYKEDLSQDVQL